MKRHLILAAVLGLGLTAPTAAFSMPPGGGPFALDRLEAFTELPSDKQELILSTLKSVREENEGLREEIRQAHEELRDILTAEEFDATAFKAQAAQLQSLMSQGFVSFTDAIAEVAPQLTQEEREILVQLAPRGPGGHGGGGDTVQKQ